MALNCKSYLRCFGLCLTLSWASPGWAQRESKTQKMENTQALRRMLMALTRWELDQGSGAVVFQADWDVVRKKLLPPELKTYDPLVGDAEDLSKGHDARAKLYKLFMNRFSVYSAPAQTPDKDLGFEVYRDHCAACHGDKADGKSPVAGSAAFKKKRPPTDFTSSDFRGRSSPFYSYNVLLQGIAGTAKVSYASRLTDHEIWSVAFVIQGVATMGSWSSFVECTKVKARDVPGSLKDFATQNDSEISQGPLSLKPSEILKDARCSAPFNGRTPR